MSRRFLATLFLPTALICCARAGNSDLQTGGAETGSDSSAVEPGDAGNAPADAGSAALPEGAPSAATDAGTSGGSDAGSGAVPEAASVPCVGGAAASIHDDFESGSLGQWTLTDRDFNPLMAGQNVVTIDATRAHSGTHAVKVSTSNGSGGLFGTAPPGQAFYGRAWVYMDADPGMGHWEGIVGLGVTRNEGGSAPEQLRLGGQFDILYMNASQTDGYFLSNPNFFSDHIGPKPPVARWVCEEFLFASETVRWWITEQGMPPASAPVIDIEPTSHWYQGQPPSPWSPAYTSFVLGYGTFGAAALDVWYDDVALDANRICCE